ncbi:MAG: flavodoxin family protein [Planctomycetota bacterium]
MILVINGSPKPDSNLRRMLRKIASCTGHEYEMVDLAKLRIKPCIGCVKCAKTNRCVVKDDMAPLYDKIVQSEAMIVGGVTYFAHPNGFTRNFLERMFPLRHVEPQTKDKIGAAVAVGGDEAEQTVREIAYHLESYFNFRIAGQVFFNSATPPCFICGFGTTCRYGGPARWMTPAEFEAFTEVKPEMFQNFEDHPEVVGACEKLAQEIKTGIESGPSRKQA